MTLSIRVGHGSIGIFYSLLGISFEFAEISIWVQMATFPLDFEGLWRSEKRDRVVLSAKIIDIYIQIHR